MNTVQKNNNITKKQVQELLEENQEKLGLSEKNLKKLIKSMKSHTISRQMRKIFYQECLKKIERKEDTIDGKFKHLTAEERISIEILHTAGFRDSFIAAFIGKNRSSIKREIDKNIIEIWDINSTKSPYTEKGQINIKYYSAEKAQKNAKENKLKNRKRCKLDRYPRLRGVVVALLKEKEVDYSPDIIANFSKANKLKDAEVTIGTNAIYRAVKSRKYGLTINDLPHGRAYHKKQDNNPHTETKEISERKKEISIEVMPEKIKNNEVDTHFQGDSVIGVAKGTHNTLITLVNTVSHPYASYERGCNENKNRLIRRYFKKGKLVEKLSDEDILNIERKINNMPRKALGYRTPLEVFEENLKKRGLDTSFLDQYRIKLPNCLVA